MAWWALQCAQVAELRCAFASDRRVCSQLALIAEKNGKISNSHPYGFAIYQNNVGLGNIYRNYFYETVELPNPRPTQPKKNQVKSGIWATFSHSKKCFVGWD